MKIRAGIIHKIPRVLNTAFVALMVLLLGACSGGVQPFSKSNTPSGKPPPAITLTAMNGLPADKAKILFANLVKSAGKRDVAIVQGAFANGYSMVGSFEALPTDTGTNITYRWTIYNGKKQVIHNLANSEVARIGGADPWSGVDPDLLRRIADFTAENIATRLHSLGYATRLAGLVPPVSLVRAGPNASKEIDYETVNGPGSVPAYVQPGQVAGTNLTQPRVNNAIPAQPRQRVASVQPVPTEKEVITASTPKPKKQLRKKTNKKTISAVAMTSVSGSPGKGNRQLLVAMRKTMASAGWPVLTSPRHDALTVTGRVKLDPPIGNKQKVAVAWTVKAPDGKVLGVVRQANSVPSGSLNKGWGENATYVSQAAAQGIFDLVKKFK